MKISFWSMLLCSALTAGPVSASVSFADRQKQFMSTLDHQPLAVYWYWMAGNISREGVVKDLQAMKRVGINRVQIGIIGEGQGTPAGPVKTLSEEWWSVLHQALKTAGELDIEVGIFNCPGWSQSGGPWVKPEQAARYLACEKDTVKGGRMLVKKLRKDGPEEQFVNLIAYPLMTSKVKFSYVEDLSKSKEINFTSPVAAKVRSIVITPVSKTCTADCELLVKTSTGYKTVKKFNIDRRNSNLNVGFNPYAPVAVSLPETEGREFRLILSTPDVVDKVTLSEIPVVERYAEKSLAKMWQTPHPMFDAYMWPQQPEYAADKAIPVGEVKDLSQFIDNGGVLHWRIPKGNWVIMRNYMRPTGVVNSPAPKDATGYETDKMSKTHIRAHFYDYLGQILKRIPAEDRKTFKIVVEDSYETGGQNWTDSMITDFRKVYGYDPVPYMPVFDGVVIGSEEQSDRFLWDVRRLIADEVAYNYVGGLREVSHEHGLTTWLENYGHWGFPGEFLQYGGQSDEIAGEFWSFGDLGDIENRVASSCGHIYGKPKVWAESFTSGGPDFTQYPGQMKQRGDRFFTEGINATLLHLYIAQPDDVMPGINAHFGSEFNRNNTWFSQMDLFAKYLKRCNYMLQQGRYVADVAYFIGEDAPKMNGVCDPALPHGYSFDFVNAEVLKGATINNGRLHLESGMEYSVLVLPKIDTMRPEMLAVLQKLVRNGLVIVGPAPKRSPGLSDYPMCDKQVRKMAAEMWQKSVAYGEAVNYGRGRIYADAALEKVISDLNIKPDFTADDNQLPLLFIHLTEGDGDVYFISNQGDKPISFNGAFRVHGKRPELWNPLDADVRLLPQFSAVGEITQVPLQLQPFESSFIVFRSVGRPQPELYNYPQKILQATVNKPWTVSFEQGKRGPVGDVRFDSLVDWSKSTDDRLKYFSGTAVYTNMFNLKRLPKEDTYIDLGKVMVMAKVWINDQYCGGVWTSPYRVNISKFLKKGRNTIRVEVVNNWHNRIIADLNLPEARRLTKQSYTYLKKDTPLQSSGLLGPVEIVSYPYIKE